MNIEEFIKVPTVECNLQAQLVNYFLYLFADMGSSLIKQIDKKQQ